MATGDRPPDTPPNSPPHTGAARTMQVLEFLAKRTLPTPTMIISQECGIPKSSLHNLLNLMRARRFVTYHGAPRAWSLGPRLFEISGEAPLLPHALAVLRAFGQGTAPLDTAEISQRSGLSPTIVARILSLLEESGLLGQTAGGRYRPGLQLVALASRVGPLDQLRLIARPILGRLRDVTGETANLVVLEAEHALYIDQVESRHALRHTGWVGRRIPLERTATGAALSGESGAQVVRDAVELGVTAIACVIPGMADPRAAVSVTGPNFRLEGGDFDRGRAAVEGAAQAIGSALAAILSPDDTETT